MKVKRQHKNATKDFDYTTIADRLRTVSWSNYCHATGLVKPVSFKMEGHAKLLQLQYDRSTCECDDTLA